MACQIVRGSSPELTADVSWVAYKFVASIAEEMAEDGLLVRTDSEGFMRSLMPDEFIPWLIKRKQSNPIIYRLTQEADGFNEDNPMNEYWDPGKLNDNNKCIKTKDGYYSFGVWHSNGF